MWIITGCRRNKRAAWLHGILTDTNVPFIQKNTKNRALCPQTQYSRVDRECTNVHNKIHLCVFAAILRVALFYYTTHHMFIFTCTGFSTHKKYNIIPWNHNHTIYAEIWSIRCFICVCVLRTIICLYEEKKLQNWDQHAWFALTEPLQTPCLIGTSSCSFSYSSVLLWLMLMMKNNNKTK